MAAMKMCWYADCEICDDVIEVDSEGLRIESADELWEILEAEGWLIDETEATYCSNCRDDNNPVS